MWPCERLNHLFWAVSGRSHDLPSQNRPSFSPLRYLRDYKAFSGLYSLSHVHLPDSFKDSDPDQPRVWPLQCGLLYGRFNVKRSQCVLSFGKMSKRLHETEIWRQDWFIVLPIEYKLFWMYILDICDHAGIWKPEKVAFERSTNVIIDLETALQLYNQGKQRIEVLINKRWWIKDFVLFQYKKLVPNNPLHNSVLSIMNLNHIDHIPYLAPDKPLPRGYLGAKEKEKAIYVVKKLDVDVKKEETKEKKGRAGPPTLEEVIEYTKAQNFQIDASEFLDYYTARGWQFKNGQPVKDWKACVRTWKRRSHFTSFDQKVKSGDPLWMNQ